MANLHAILFDLDGVLVDVSGSYRRAIGETVERFTGTPPEPASIQALKDGGGYNDDWRLTAELIARRGVRVPFGDVVREFNRRYRGERWDGLIAGEPPLASASQLDALKDRVGPLGLVTGRPREEAEFTLARFGWTDRFDAVVTIDDTPGRGKPDPLPVRIALERIGIPAEGAVYVGDSVDDMVAARAAGCLALGFVPPYLDGTLHGALLRERGAFATVTGHDALMDVVSALV